MYRLKTNKLKKLSQCAKSTAASYVVLVMCGAFNPIHSAHIQLYEASKRKMEEENSVVLGGFVSPVSDAYKKPGLASFRDRSAVVELALEDHAELALDEWEGLQPTYTRTYFVLAHIEVEIREYYQSSEPTAMNDVQSSGQELKVVFACGGDLFASFFIPNVWPLNFLQRLIDEFPIVVAQRELGGITGEGELRERMAHCSLIQEIDGSVFQLSFQTSRIHFCRFIFDDNTSSTQIRELVKRCWDHDSSAMKELEQRMPLKAVCLTMEVYKPNEF